MTALMGAIERTHRRRSVQNSNKFLFDIFDALVRPICQYFLMKKIKV